MAGLPNLAISLQLEVRPGTPSIDPLLANATARGLFGVPDMPVASLLPLTRAAANSIDPSFRCCSDRE